MFKRIVLFALIASASTGDAFAAGNFAFLVPGDAGLSLEITGYAQDGTKIFDQRPNGREDNNGNPGYIVRVDEGIIFKTKPAKWCVDDLAGTWNAIPNDVAVRQLCDSSPVDTKGTYVFAADRAPDAPLRFDVGAGVPKADLALIKSGLQLAEDYANEHLGGVDPKLRQEMLVTVVATGKGNYEEAPPGSIGDPASSFYHNAPGPFFDVAHKAWKRGGGGVWTLDSYRTETVAHEYGHLWMYSLGAFSQGFQTMTRWMNEGIATYYGYATVVADHRLTFAQARTLALASAGKEMPVSLDTLPTNIWPGDAGFLAIDWLVSESPNGLLSLRKFGSNLGQGQPVEVAFKGAFGLELSDFYRQFEPWRKIVLASPKHAFERRPHLVFAAN